MLESGMDAPFIVPSTNLKMAYAMSSAASEMNAAADTIVSLRDRLQAVSETCKNANKDGYGFRFECSKCGYGSITTNCRTRNDELPKFCPNCGAKAVKR